MRRGAHSTSHWLPGGVRLPTTRWLATTAPAAGPLSGLRVLDCGNFLAGPVVSLHLGAMGAEVIKIEKPKGDDSRAVGPFAKDGESSYYLSINRGKRSVALDTRTDAGRAIFQRLAVTADVIVENYRPGVMDRNGIGYEALKQSNPGLVYAAISGFGQRGEHASRPAFDSLLQAAGGLISVTGPADVASGGPGGVSDAAGAAGAAGRTGAAGAGAGAGRGAPGPC